MRVTITPLSTEVCYHHSNPRAHIQQGRIPTMTWQTMCTTSINVLTIAHNQVCAKKVAHFCSYTPVRQLCARLLKAGVSYSVRETCQLHQLLHLRTGISPEEGLDSSSPGGRAGAQVRWRSALAQTLTVFGPQQLLQEALAKHSLVPALALRSKATHLI